MYRIYGFHTVAFYCRSITIASTIFTIVMYRLFVFYVKSILIKKPNNCILISSEDGLIWVTVLTRFYNEIISTAAPINIKVWKHRLWMVARICRLTPLLYKISFYSLQALFVIYCIYDPTTTSASPRLGGCYNMPHSTCNRYHLQTLSLFTNAFIIFHIGF